MYIIPQKCLGRFFYICRFFMYVITHPVGIVQQIITKTVVKALWMITVAFSYYRPPMKRQKGNVFGHVCLFSWGQRGGYLYKAPIPASLCTGPQSRPPSVQGPNPLDMCKLVPLGPHCTGSGSPPPNIHRHSNLFTMKHGLSESGRSAFNWNAFLLKKCAFQIIVCLEFAICYSWCSFFFYIKVYCFHCL